MAQAADAKASADALVRSVWWTLRVVFGVVPIVAGLDKYFDLLVDWDKYLSPVFRGLIPVSPESFMYLVGVVEIIAGLGVLFSGPGSSDGSWRSGSGPSPSTSSPVASTTSRCGTSCSESPQRASRD